MREDRPWQVALQEQLTKERDEAVLGCLDLLLGALFHKMLRAPFTLASSSSQASLTSWVPSSIPCRG